jgi:hypothetical protein
MSVMLSKVATASFDALRLLRMGIILILCCWIIGERDKSTIKNNSFDVFGIVRDDGDNVL